MGYFSNGCEGLDYQERWCLRCIHYGDEDGPGCPVWGLHLAWNSESYRDETKDSALRHFIPRSEDGLRNEKCRMFVPGEGAG